MRVTVVELPATWGEPERALAEVDAILAAGPATDLVLLPETSLTGYVSPALDFDLTRFAEPLDGATAQALADLARKHHTHLFGPLVLAEGGHMYNTTIGFAPTGRHVATYRKRHPWIPETWASAGREPYPLFTIAGRTVTIACCYDVHFLADDAAGALDRADVLLFPSAWVEQVSTRLRRLERLAREHHLAIVAANWGRGRDLAVHGQGDSAILNATGDQLARVTPPARRADAELT
ncbi:MAG: carbon-nitrogen hydrolase family protein [Labilithrix sp.]|nr:carbon-nitrogen hydrolase family protein [Labilithrix sp.]MCW5812241.1 carbon-nitrogen hydrolase family protein [Labilithrix sp.]